MPRRIALVLMIVLSCMTLQSCSRATFLVLLNNSGQAIEVLRASAGGDPNAQPEGDRSWSWPWTWRFLIANGRQREVAYYDGEDGWDIELQVGACRRRYIIPLDERPSDVWGDLWVPFDERTEVASHQKVQIQSDLTLHLTPSGTERVYDVQQLASLQPEGFPARPTTQTCVAPR